MVGIWAGGVAHTPLTLNTARTTLDSSCCSFQESCGQFNSKKLVCWLVFPPLTKVLLAMDQESMVSGVLSSPYPQIWEPELGLNLPTWLRANIQTTNLIVSPILFGFRFSELLHTLLCDWQLATCNGKREQSVMEHRGGGGEKHTPQSPNQRAAIYSYSRGKKNLRLEKFLFCFVEAAKG